MQQERLIVAIAAKTAAEVMLHITKNYVQERKAFGKNISDFQTVQFRLAEMYTEIEIGRTFVDDCITAHMNGENIVTKVSMAKWWLTDLAKKCQQSAYSCTADMAIWKNMRLRDVIVIFQ